MPTITADYSLMNGTNAAIGRSGSHTVVADRKEGVAGGQGLGFNGGQLLALALGGCFCNDLQYSAEELQQIITDLTVHVSLTLGGTPTFVQRADVAVTCVLEGGMDPADLLEHAKARCTIANSLRAGAEVNFS